MHIQVARLCVKLAILSGLDRLTVPREVLTQLRVHRLCLLSSYTEERSIKGINVVWQEVGPLRRKCSWFGRVIELERVMIESVLRNT